MSVYATKRDALVKTCSLRVYRHSKEILGGLFRSEANRFNLQLDKMLRNFGDIQAVVSDVCSCTHVMQSLCDLCRRKLSSLLPKPVQETLLVCKGVTRT